MHSLYLMQRFVSTFTHTKEMLLGFNILSNMNMLGTTFCLDDDQLFGAPASSLEDSKLLTFNLTQNTNIHHKTHFLLQVYCNDFAHCFMTRIKSSTDGKQQCVVSFIQAILLKALQAETGVSLFTGSWRCSNSAPGW